MLQEQRDKSPKYITLFCLVETTSDSCCDDNGGASAATGSVGGGSGHTSEGIVTSISTGTSSGNNGTETAIETSWAAGSESATANVAFPSLTKITQIVRSEPNILETMEIMYKKLFYKRL